MTELLKEEKEYAGRLRRNSSRADRSRSALAGQITRLKKRIVQGCCPFCGWQPSHSLQRTVKGPCSVQEHLAVAHPAMVKKYGVKK